MKRRYIYLFIVLLFTLFIGSGFYYFSICQSDDSGLSPQDSGTSDNLDVSMVEFYVDDNLLCTKTETNDEGVYECSWDTSRYHSRVVVYAYDEVGNRSAALIRETEVDPRLYLTELPKTGI